MHNYETWLLFSEGETWTRRITAKGFGHVVIIARDKFNWFYFNPTRFGLEFTVLPYAADEHVIDLIDKEKYAILKVECRQNKTKSFLSPLRPFSCVSAVKYFLGINIFALTPYTLYWKLVKMRRKDKYCANITHIEIL